MYVRRVPRPITYVHVKSDWLPMIDWTVFIRQNESTIHSWCRRRHRRVRVMYQGRNSSCVRLVTGWNRARNRVLLFLGWRASLRQTFESFERVIDEHPVLVYYLSVLRHRRRRCNQGREKKRGNYTRLRVIERGGGGGEEVTVPRVSQYFFVEVQWEL